MVDFSLSTANMVRQDSINLTTQGTKYPMMEGRAFKVEFRLHREEFRDPKDPEKPITFFCLHLPQINMSYVDETEEKVFEALQECFEEDFILFYATKLNEERENDGR